MIEDDFPDGRIEAFLDIRDRQFRFDFVDRNHDWSSFSKARRLTAYLEYIGIAARTICGRFSWADTILPRDIVANAPAIETYHFFTEAFIPETRRWEKIDPTWDSGLKNPDFFVANWDGRNSTPLAVAMRPGDIFSPGASANFCQLIEDHPPEKWLEFHRYAGHFYAQVNRWIARYRLKEPHA